SMWMPPAASGPVLTVIRPILSGAFCATAGSGNAATPAAAAEDCRNLRRLTRTDMSFLPGLEPDFVILRAGAGGRPGPRINLHAARGNSGAVDAGRPAVRREVVLRHPERLGFERRRHGTIPAGQKAGHRDGCDNFDDLLLAPMGANVG